MPDTAVSPDTAAPEVASQISPDQTPTAQTPAAQTPPKRQRNRPSKSAVGNPAARPAGKPVPAAPRSNWKNQNRETLLSEVAQAAKNDQFILLSAVLEDGGEDIEHQTFLHEAYRRDIKAGLLFAVPTDGDTIVLFGGGEFSNELIALTPTFSQWRDETNVQFHIQRLLTSTERVEFPVDTAKRFFMEIAGARAEKKGVRP